MLIHFCVKKTVVRLCLSSASHSAPPSYLTSQLDSPAFTVLLDDSEAQLIKGAYSRPLICQDVYIQVPLQVVLLECSWYLKEPVGASWCLMMSHVSLVLWCLVVCLGVLWCVLVSCGVSWCLVVCLGVLWCVLVSCGVSWCLVVCHCVLWCVLVSCGVSWCLVVCHCVLWCVLVSCGVSLCLSKFIELSVLPCFVSINTIIYFLYHLYVQNGLHRSFKHSILDDLTVVFSFIRI